MHRVYILEQGTYLRKSGNNLVLVKERTTVDEVSLPQLEHLVLAGFISLSGAVINALVQHRVETVLLDRNFGFRARLHMDEHKHYLVCFDIVDDSTRNKVAKVLKGYGYRVQKSVFECPDLTEKHFLKLKDRMESLIDQTEDSVRYYRQCKGCLRDCELSGIGDLPEIKDFQVI